MVCIIQNNLHALWGAQSKADTHIPSYYFNPFIAEVRHIWHHTYRRVQQHGRIALWQK